MMRSNPSLSAGNMGRGLDLGRLSALIFFGDTLAKSALAKSGNLQASLRSHRRSDGLLWHGSASPNGSVLQICRFCGLASMFSPENRGWVIQITKDYRRLARAQSMVAPRTFT